jgi:hypothetical protein
MAHDQTSLLFIRRYKKKGAPIIAVKIPRGISVVVKVRAILSIKRRKNAPKIMLAGKSTL